MATLVSHAPATLSWQAAASMIDHTLLKPEGSREQIEKLCREAARFGFASVCVNAYWIPVCASILRPTPVKVCTVVGFPLGATTTSTKRFETAESLRLGADEVDMVMNVGAMKSGDFARVESDVRSLAEVTHDAGGLLKVILENVLLTQEEKVAACEICVKAGADFVKTSTGFSSGGATVEDVALMRATVGNLTGVKAAGGIRTADHFLAMVNAGADRVGASASVAICRKLGAPY
ncbi:MAG: deoxyribose-phosphate aldolase [Terriglobales bacterium]